MLIGSLVAIVTPMLDNGRIDFDSYKKLLVFHIQAGSKGIVILGSTGESATVNLEERSKLIAQTIKYVNNRIPIIVGTGSNCTQYAIDLTNAAQKAGANYSLSVVPYYNRPSQTGLYQHFKTIAESTNLPMILYNVPGRTVSDLSDETILALAKIPNIVGLKDATGNLQRAAYLTKHLPKNFTLYSGDDGSALAFLLQGGHGVISVTANVAPKAMQDLCLAAQTGNILAARTINDQLQYLHRDLFIESNPGPVKWALYAMGKIDYAHMRLPLCDLTKESTSIVRQALLKANIDLIH